MVLYNKGWPHIAANREYPRCSAALKEKFNIGTHRIFWIKLILVMLRYIDNALTDKRPEKIPNVAIVFDAHLHPQRYGIGPVSHDCIGAITGRSGKKLLFSSSRSFCRAAASTAVNQSAFIASNRPLTFGLLE